MWRHLKWNLKLVSIYIYILYMCALNRLETKVMTKDSGEGVKMMTLIKGSRRVACVYIIWEAWWGIFNLKFRKLQALAVHALNKLSQTFETIIKMNEWDRRKNVSMLEGHGRLVSAYLIIWKENCVGTLKFVNIGCLCGLLCCSVSANVMSRTVKTMCGWLRKWVSNFHCFLFWTLHQELDLESPLQIVMLSNQEYFCQTHFLVSSASPVIKDSSGGLLVGSHYEIKVTKDWQEDEQFCHISLIPSLNINDALWLSSQQMLSCVCAMVLVILQFRCTNYFFMLNVKEATVILR